MTEFQRVIDITKIDPEQQIVWGWAYVTEENGVPVVDVSEQTATAGEIQKAAHGFVRDSRVGGVMHTEAAGEIVDSLFFTADLQKALGVDLGKVGWFIGYHVIDEQVWEGVKSGAFPAFSIAGTAIEEEIAQHAA